MRVARVAVPVLLVAGVLGWRWWAHPTVFGDPGDGFRAAPLPVADAALSAAVTFPRVSGEPETVTLDGIHAVLSTNTARATTTFSICHLAPGESPINAVHDPGGWCHDIEPVRAGTSLRQGVGDDSDYLFVTITPRTAGVAHLARVEISYARGAGHLFQRGTESVRVDRALTAR